MRPISDAEFNRVCNDLRDNHGMVFADDEPVKPDQRPVPRAIWTIITALLGIVAGWVILAAVAFIAWLAWSRV